jgi:hypothetical protein
MNEKIKEINSQENINKKGVGDFWRGVNKFNKGYQPGINLFNDKNANLLARSHDISKQVKKSILSGIECSLGQT